MASASSLFDPQQRPDSDWDFARTFTARNDWSVDEYLELNGNYLIELIGGKIEVLPVPTMSHQDIMLFLYGLLRAFATPRNIGKVIVSPFKVRVGENEFCEPDVVFMLSTHQDRMNDDFWIGADLVMEIVSNNDRKRDLVTKRAVYARAKIPEYWIVDPRDARITVLKLAGDFYEVHGEFQPGQVAASHLLPEFSVDVTAALAAQ